MIVLGLETSCDETSAALVKDGREILSNIVTSQIAVHRPYSGVVPELASRAHIENVNSVIDRALSQAGYSLDSFRNEIAAVAYTKGPGLAGSLLVGQIVAQTLSYLFCVPLVGINHLEGHLYSVLLEHPRIRPPFLGLIVSGGHTELILVEDFGRYRLIGKTRDDAAGEAFDKVAKLLDLGYPGGPAIEALSRRGNAAAIKFPRPYMWESWDFSFSGLKTAVLNFVRTPLRRPSLRAEDISASFQEAVIDTLVGKTLAAARKFTMRTIVVAGGVAANAALRDGFKKNARKYGCRVYFPSPGLCTDNAAMIATAGYLKMSRGKIAPGATTADFVQKIEPGLVLQNWKR